MIQDLMDRHITHLNRQRNLYQNLCKNDEAVLEIIIKLGIPYEARVKIADLINKKADILEDLSQVSNLLAEDMIDIATDFRNTFEELLKSSKKDETKAHD